MKTNLEIKTNLERGTDEVLNFYRGMILDTIEHEYGSGDNWTFIRGRILKILGDRGLHGRIRELLNNEFRSEI